MLLLFRGEQQALGIVVVSILRVLFFLFPYLSSFLSQTILQKIKLSNADSETNPQSVRT